MTSDQIYESSRWFKQAQEELDDAVLLASKRRYYLALFLCQQSTEKALKAYLMSLVREPIITHSIARLISSIIQEDSDFESVRQARRLDDYYIQTRYPNGLPGETPAEYYDDPDEMDKAIQTASSVIRLVKEKLGY
jgi:HEPN domain-containing protein